MVTQWVLVIGAGVIGALIAVVVMGLKAKALSRELAGKEQALIAAHEQCEQVQLQSERLDDELQRIRQSLEAANKEGARLEAQLHAQVASAKQFEQYWQTSEQKVQQLQQAESSTSAQLAELRAAHSERQSSYEAQLKLLAESRDQLKKEFESLASEVIERKSKSFKELSETSLQQMLSPLHNDVKGFREKVEHIHSEETKQRASLTAELKHLQSLNLEITERAGELTNALQGQKKVQGNWGELMLENVLDSAGLRLGKDYERERSFNTEDGRLRPDAVVRLPQNKHLVIDAKTSLNAYTDYVNAEDDEVRNAALKRHAMAVGDRIKELADKNYYQLPGLNSPEVVVMFIPIESAYVEALKYDQTLYQRAISQNVLVATPTTLLTSLNIVQQLWRFENQSKHSAELASRAGKLYEKLAGYIESMQKVGRQIDSAKDSYNKAMNQLKDGRGNVIKQAAEFRDLGVSVQKEMSPELVDQAKLELPPTNNLID